MRLLLLLLKYLGNLKITSLLFELLLLEGLMLRELFFRILIKLLASLVNLFDRIDL